MSKINPRFKKNKPGRQDSFVRKMVICARIWRFSWPSCCQGQIFSSSNILTDKFYVFKRLNSTIREYLDFCQQLKSDLYHRMGILIRLMIKKVDAAGDKLLSEQERIDE